MSKFLMTDSPLDGEQLDFHRVGVCSVSGGGGGGSSTTIQEIPAELKPLATEYTASAMDLNRQPFVPYTDQRYADLTTPQMQGIDMATHRALQGSPTMGNAESQLNQMMTGGPNPYLDAMYNQAADQVQNRLNSNYSLAGRTGSNAHAETFQRGMNDLAANMYGNAYAQDQNNRLSAIGMAPQFGDAAYRDASQLLNAGQILQDQAQNPLDFQYQQFTEAQNLPYKNLAAMAGVFNSNLGGTSKTTQSGGGGK